MFNKRYKVLWSSEFDHVDGQALVTKVVHENFKSLFNSYSIYPRGLKGLPILLLLYARIYLFAALFKLDIVYIVCSRTLLGFFRDLPVLLLSRFGLKVVVHAHGSDLPDLFSNSCVGLFARLVYKRCEIIVPSSHLLEIADMTDFKLTLVENPFQGTVQRHPALRPENEAIDRKSKVKLLWNSNIIFSKGFVDVFYACEKIIASKKIPLELWILGRPIGDSFMSASEMEQFVSDVVVKSDFVTYLGPVDFESMLSLLEGVDIVALPSFYKSECQPLALISAMCFGTKIVARDTPALRATLLDYPSYFCKSSNEVADGILAQIAVDGINKSIVEASKDRFSNARFLLAMTKVLTVN